MSFLAVGPRANLNLRGTAVLVVLEADEFHQVADARRLVRTEQAADEVQLDRLGERAGIFDREVVLDAAPARARPALDRVELLGVRCAAAGEPELVVVADGVNHPRVAFPGSNRMAPPIRHPVL